MEAFLIGSALKEFARPKRLVLWIVLAVAVGALGTVFLNLDRHSALQTAYATLTSIMVFRILALAAAIFATAVVSQEVEQKTIVYLLTRPIPRWKLIVTRFVASAIVVAFVGIVSAVAVSFGVFGVKALSNELLVHDIVAICLGAFAYTSIFLLVSLLFNRAMIICLLYAFGWETMASNMAGEVNRLSIVSYMQAIAQHPSGPNESGPMQALSSSLSGNAITASTAYPTLVLIGLVALAISAFWFTQFEYVPREDAE